ncbi:hypothetical protein F2Q70_00003210 [Brassica cretica]|uniref:Uncharacterized protein n=1 Tax=Brassica cretica TaxID=69181 RepID=A0A8S9ILW8_BRACR|nr:hypothetical protein F2Q70_00003210 [Brassica cretica]
MYAKRLRTKLIYNSSDYKSRGEIIILKGAYELDQVSRDLRSWPTLTKVARPQRIKTGMRHKAGMGMRKPEEQYISCFSRREKQRKPGTWVTTPTPAPFKLVRRTSGFLYGLRVPKEGRTSVQFRAHRGHYNFKEPPGSKQRSLDPNLRVPTRPQRPYSILAKRIEPPCSLGRIGVITSLKDLRVPTRPQGPGAPGSRYDLRI